MQSDYGKKIQDLDHQIEDKDKRIKELLHHLKHSDDSATIPRPPGVARRTASIGVQTSQEPPTSHTVTFHEDTTSQAVLPSSEDVSPHPSAVC